jgi:hypothetical protein
MVLPLATRCATGGQDSTFLAVLVLHSCTTMCTRWLLQLLISLAFSCFVSGYGLKHRERFPAISSIAIQSTPGMVRGALYQLSVDRQ